MSVSAVVSLACSLLGGVAWRFGKAGLEKPGGVASERLYSAAWKLGPVLAILGACVGVALQAGVAP